jgi:polyisoprenyl-teichoic acid--peptidoglycan teichoic acid transferase
MKQSVAFRLLLLATLFGAATFGNIASLAGAQDPVIGNTTILLLGGDAGPQRDGIRTDTMIVASVDPETGRTALIGVPRNLVNTPLPEPYASLFVCGCWESLLNELYEFAEANPDLFGGGSHPGGQVMMDTIEYLIGLDIDYFALVDLTGFVRVFDALGGVDIEVPEPMAIYLSPAVEGEDWEQYVIPAGWQHLDGRAALAYTRSREDESDYDRMARQRCLIGALARQTDVETLLRNYPSVTNEVRDAVRTNVPVDKLPELIELMGEVDLSATATLGLTDSVFMTDYIDEGYPVPNPAAMNEAVALLFNLPIDEVASTYGTIPAACGWTSP